jgi:acetylornithine deacetylase
MPLDPIALARQLIDIPSTTDNEFAHAALLEQTLHDLGFNCRRYPITPERFNLLALAGGKPRVVLNSHLDTVPPWFPSSQRDGFLYGRGACDTKGIIAAMVAASERLLIGGVRDFALLFVVGEETDSIGAKTANQELAELGSEFCVVGEPTESRFARASKGAFTAFVRFEGVAAHSAYPERGDSAIVKLTRAIDEIYAADWGSDPILGNATPNVGVIRGGEKPNIIPAVAELEMLVRTVGPLEPVREQIAAIAARHGGRITVERGNPPMLMVVPDGAPSDVVAFNTDVPHLGNLGKPILFGPGSILDAHGAEEKIAERDLLEAVGVYHDLVVELLAGGIA